jgi:hypothetical protein
VRIHNIFLGLLNRTLKKRGIQGKCCLECVFLLHSGFVQPSVQHGFRNAVIFFAKTRIKAAIITQVNAAL